MKWLKLKGLTAIIGLVLMLSFDSGLFAAAIPNPSWTVDDPVIFHSECEPYDHYAAKDPTIVYYEGQYLVYYTGANASGGWQMCFTSAPTIPELKNARRTYMSKIGEAYFCAPELFYFESQQLWYLVYQDGTHGAAYSTSTDPADPNSWVGPKSFGFSGSMGWDYYVICDDQYAYMYNTPSATDAEHKSKLFMRKTTLENFPNKGWSTPTAVCSNVFEAAEIYKCLTDGQYYLLVEAMIDGRSYSLFSGPTAGGPWTLVNSKWATKTNLTTYRGTKWTTNVSHGELIRAGYNQKLEINDINKVDFLIQGTTNMNAPYQEIIWDLGLIRNYTGPQQENNSSSYSLNIITRGRGTVTRSPDESSYEKDATVTVTATATDGWIFDSWSGDASGNQNPLTLTMDKVKSIAANFTTEDGKQDLIINGNFLSGGDSWAFNNWGGTGAGSVENAEYKLAVSSVSDDYYDIQVVQPGILLEKSKTYRLIYDAHASANRALNVNIGMPEEPYTTFLSDVIDGETEVDLTTSKQSFSLDFVMKEETYDDSRVEFSVGLNTPTVYIDNVSLFEIEGTAVSAPVRNKSTKQINVRQNGSLVNITFNTTGKNSAFLNIYDLKGSVYHSNDFITQSGSTQNFSFNTSGMSKGYYIVKIRSGNTVHKSGFVLTGK